jgi:hypothetical protein
MTASEMRRRALASVRAYDHALGEGTGRVMEHRQLGKSRRGKVAPQRRKLSSNLAGRPDVESENYALPGAL